jgi:cell division transport system permease protein
MLSVRAYALLALLLVLCIATAIVGLATHAGLAARRETIYIVHGLGATDGFIAYRFAGRTGMQALLGGAAGALLAVPVLLTLAELAAPFTRAATAPGPVAAPTAAAFVQALPAPLWVAVAGLPVAAWLIGWVTVQVSVRLWLARLP